MAGSFLCELLQFGLFFLLVIGLRILAELVSCGILDGVRGCLQSSGLVPPHRAAADTRSLQELRCAGVCATTRLTHVGRAVQELGQRADSNHRWDHTR